MRKKKYGIAILICIVILTVCIAVFYKKQPEPEYIVRMNSELDKYGFNGSYLVAQGDDILLYGARGRTRNGREITGDSVLPINSLTKQFCGMAVHKMILEGGINIDSTLDIYFPQSGYAGNITVGQLLNMTSGIPDYTGDEVLNKKYGPLFQKSIREEIKYRILNYTPAGSGYSYSNSNYYLLGSIVEQVSKETFDTYIRKNFLEPAGMKNTVFSFRESIAESEYDPVYTFSAGCMCSTVKDLYSWQKNLYGGSFGFDVKEKIKNEAAGYDTGLEFAGGIVRHSGTGRYYRSTMIYDTAKDIHIILLGADDEKENGELADRLYGIAAAQEEK